MNGSQNRPMYVDCISYVGEGIIGTKRWASIHKKLYIIVTKNSSLRRFTREMVLNYLSRDMRERQKRLVVKNIHIKVLQALNIFYTLLLNTLRDISLPQVPCFVD